jgi:hypothetical protein
VLGSRTAVLQLMNDFPQNRAGACMPRRYSLEVRQNRCHSAGATHTQIAGHTSGLRQACGCAGRLAVSQPCRLTPFEKRRTQQSACHVEMQPQFREANTTQTHPRRREERDSESGGSLEQSGQDAGKGNTTPSPPAAVQPLKGSLPPLTCTKHLR